MSENQFTYKDQLMLNQYAGLKKEVEDLQQELKKDHEDLESLRDALDELEIYKCKAPPEFDKIRNLPPPLQFRWGETFSTWDPQTVGDILESQLNGLETMVEQKEEDVETYLKRKEELRENLEERFGDLVTFSSTDEEDEETEE